MAPGVEMRISTRLIPPAGVNGCSNVTPVP